MSSSPRRDGTTGRFEHHVRKSAGAAKRILSLAISVTYFATHAALRAIVRLVGATAPSGPDVVLTYHGVPAAEVPQFQRQMEYLKRKAFTVFADEVGTLNGPCVAVTFDDALQSVFDRALPILQHYEIPASVFVPTGYLGSGPGWMATDSRLLPDPVVSARTLESVDHRRLRIGSHSVSHRHLSDIGDAELETELVESMAVLERITKYPVRMMALPYGSSSPKVIAAASRAGYDRVFANVPVRAGTASPLVGRVNASPRDWPLEYYLKVEGAYHWMAVAIPMKRALLRAFHHRTQS